MYKTGVCRAQNVADSRTFIGTTRQFSYSLLSIPARPSTEDVLRFETVLRTVRTSSGVFRTTYHSRFEDVDVLVGGVLQRVFPARRSLELHDLAASDGRLSLDWARQTLTVFPGARTTASDIMLYFTEATHESGDIYILQEDGTPIQYTKPPFVVSLDRREHPAYPLNALVRAWGIRRLRDLRSCSVNMSWNGVADQSVVERGRWRFRQIPLVHPAALAFIRDDRFRIVHVDAFQPLALKCDVIRAMNLYQPSVFSQSMIRQGIWSAMESLHPEGVFIAGRTMEREGGRNDVSIFQKTCHGVRVLETLGRGFEFRDVVLNWQQEDCAVSGSRAATGAQGHSVTARGGQTE